MLESNDDEEEDKKSHFNYLDNNSCIRFLSSLFSLYCSQMAKRLVSYYEEFS